jgi:hypothetical protein
VIVARPNISTAGAIINVAADNTRVGIVATGVWANTTGALDIRFRILDASGATVFHHQLIAKEADVAAVTPSPVNYNPLILTTLDIGPLITFNMTLTATGLTTSCLLELLLNPSLDGAPQPLG